VKGIGSVAHLGHSFVFVLTEDNKLRTFDLPSRKCLVTYDLNTAIWEDSEIASGFSFESRALKLVAGPVQTSANSDEPTQPFTIVIYFGTDKGESRVRGLLEAICSIMSLPKPPLGFFQFVTLEGQVTSALTISYQITGTYYHENDQLIDFDVVPTGLWALWQSMSTKSSFSLQYTYRPTNVQYPDLFDVDTWTDVVLESVDAGEAIDIINSAASKSALGATPVALSSCTCSRTRESLKVYDPAIIDYSVRRPQIWK